MRAGMQAAGSRSLMQQSGSRGTLQHTCGAQQAAPRRGPTHRQHRQQRQRQAHPAQQGPAVQGVDADPEGGAARHHEEEQLEGAAVVVLEYGGTAVQSQYPHNPGEVEHQGDGKGLAVPDVQLRAAGDEQGQRLRHEHVAGSQQGQTCRQRKAGTGLC